LLGFRLQSAMEYLMTYGWAILIIAVVLGALFGLGFFNSATLAPKVAAGSCQVYRPNGPGTTTFINTEGVCNNELPQYVGKFSSASSFVTIPYSSVDTLSQFTVVAWVYINGCSSSQWNNIFQAFNGIGLTGYGLSFWSASNTCSLAYGPPGNLATFYTLSTNTWYQLATTEYGASGQQIWLDGSLIYTCSANCFNGVGQNPTNKISLYASSEANLQVYNTSLSANEIAALYSAGIGGGPVLLNNLVGWWPLNGNANDYSGNLNNGVPTNVVFTSSWTAGYSAP